jgi:outer membrane immunogenic protein
MKKSLLLTGVSALALCAGKSAADAADLRAPAYKAPPLAPAPVFSWTGCYVGPHVGWGWSKLDTTATQFASGSAGLNRGSKTINASGAVFGTQAGCNYQFNGNWVIGIQGDFAGTDINGGNHNPTPALASDNDAQVRVKVDWLASITGRIGWAATGLFTANPTLFYFKGGGAWAHERWDISDSVGDEITQTRNGWTVGAGIETVLVGNWTFVSEIDYYDFGSKSFGFNSSGFGTGNPTTFDVKHTMWESKFGLNYKFF